MVKADAVIFDQGNTLLMDPFRPVMELKKNEFAGLFRSRGIAVEARRIVGEWTASNREISYPYIAHFFQEEPIVQHALRRLGVPADAAAVLGLELLKEYRAGLKEIVQRDARTRKVERVLNGLKEKGKRLGVLSNDRAFSLDAVLEWMGIRPYFEYVGASESIGVEKPDPAVFMPALDHFKLPPGRMAYVGDDPVRDIDAAKSNGLKAILYSVDIGRYNETWRNYGAKPKYEPDRVIRDLSELATVIE